MGIQACFTSPKLWPRIVESVETACAQQKLAPRRMAATATALQVLEFFVLAIKSTPSGVHVPRFSSCNFSISCDHENPCLVIHECV